MARRFEAIVDALSVVYRISSDFVVLDCWPGRFAPPFLGEPDELVGRRVAELYPGETGERLSAGITKAIDTGDVVFCDFESPDRAGRLSMYRQVRYARCGADEVIGVTRDITEERCRHDAEHVISDASRRLLQAPALHPDEAVAEVLRRASTFVDAVGMSVFTPVSDAANKFERTYQWSALGATFTPNVDVGEPTWLARILNRLERPVIWTRAEITPDSRGIARLLDSFGLAAVGYIPIGNRDGAGFVGTGFVAPPDRIQQLRFESLGGFGSLLASVIERQRSEQRRHDAGVLLHSLVEHTSEVIAVLDRDGHPRYVGGPDTHSDPGDRGPADPDHAWGSVLNEDRADLAAAFEAALRTPEEATPVAYRLVDNQGEIRQLVGTFTNLLHAPAVAGVVLNARDVTEQRAARAALELAARHDSLTKLPNRDALAEQLTLRLAAPDASEAVLFIDLDHFERINDAYGHTAGDTVLIHMATRLRDLCTPTGIVARFAGDKFVVTYPIRTEPELRRLAETIRREIARPIGIDHAHLRISASIGALIAEPSANVESLLGDADAALHHAKLQGRDRHAIWDDALRQHIRQRADLETSLTVAVDRDELQVHYQPVIELATNTTVGAEALVRWQRPGHGLVAPGDFLSVAEETGLVHQVDLWMLRHAIHQTAGWHRHHLNIAVNLSVHELDQPDLETAIHTTLQASGLNPNDLCLEITETGYAQASTDAIALLQRLRTRGVRIAIDDFGAGYSSIERVRRFPIDIIKIDRSFITTITNGPRDHAIVHAIIELAHALELHVVAEGVETQAQHDTLRQLGCDHAQGFLYGHPMTAPDFVAHLATHPHRRNTTPLRRAT